MLHEAVLESSCPQTEDKMTEAQSTLRFYLATVEKGLGSILRHGPEMVDSVSMRIVDSVSATCPRTLWPVSNRANSNCLDVC